MHDTFSFKFGTRISVTHATAVMELKSSQKSKTSSLHLDVMKNMNVWLLRPYGGLCAVL